MGGEGQKKLTTTYWAHFPRRLGGTPIISNLADKQILTITDLVKPFKLSGLNEAVVIFQISLTLLSESLLMHSFPKATFIMIPF